MICHLSGTLIGKDVDTIFIDINGVGYGVITTQKILDAATVDADISCFVFQIVKEDGAILYGFENFNERVWFEYLIKIDGLGPKTAMSIISKFPTHAIEGAILSKNEDFFISITGIGKKIAGRIMIEMISKIQKINERIMLFTGRNVQSNGISHDKNHAIVHGAIQVITALGLGSTSLYDTLTKLATQEKCTTQEELIKIFLQHKDEKKI